MSLDAKKEDPLERKVKIMALSVILGILSFFISIVAIGIAIYSHVMMKSNLLNKRWKILNSNF